MGEGITGDVFRNRFLLHEVQSDPAIKTFEILVLVQMLYVASYRIQLAHCVMFTGADE